MVDRDGLLAHYGDDLSVDTDLIPAIDFWLTRGDGSVGTLAEAVAPAAPFQHVVASHVIEHVPDMVGWLRDVADVLVDGGSLLLAVPDLRFCFDARRPPTTLGQVVQAHLDGDRIPSFRAVYDHFRTTVPFPAHEAWAGTWPPERRLNPMSEVRSAVERQQRGEYVDCHVWCLTPVRFVDILVDLLELGLLDFAVERVSPTLPGHLEFYATLRRFPRERPAGAVTAALEQLVAIRDALPDEERAWPHQVREQELTARQEALEHRLQRSEAQVVELVRMREAALAQRAGARGATARVSSATAHVRASRRRRPGSSGLVLGAIGSRPLSRRSAAGGRHGCRVACAAFCGPAPNSSGSSVAASSAWAMWAHRAPHQRERRPEPANANHQGAVSPEKCAMTPPRRDPTSMPLVKQIL